MGSSSLKAAPVFLILKLDCAIPSHPNAISLLFSFKSYSPHLKQVLIFSIKISLYTYLPLHSTGMEWFLFMAYSKIHFNTISVFLNLAITEGWSHPITWREKEGKPSEEEEVSSIVAAAAISNLPIQTRIFEIGFSWASLKHNECLLVET